MIKVSIGDGIKASHETILKRLREWLQEKRDKWIHHIPYYGHEVLAGQPVIITGCVGPREGGPDEVEIYRANCGWPNNKSSEPTVELIDEVAA